MFTCTHRVHTRAPAMEGILSQRVPISNHHNVRFNYLTVLRPLYLSKVEISKKVTLPDGSWSSRGRSGTVRRISALQPAGSPKACWQRREVCPDASWWVWTVFSFPISGIRQTFEKGFTWRGTKCVLVTRSYFP